MKTIELFWNGYHSIHRSREYSARIDTLWMRVDLRGVAIGAAYWRPLFIAVVGSRLRVSNLSAYTELRRWLALCVMGLSRAARVLWWQAQPVGKRAIAANKFINAIKPFVNG